METFRKIYPSEFYRKFLVHNVRPDGRTLSSIRNTTISTGSVTAADGSAFVKMGHTAMVAGVKAELGSATPKTPSGQIVVNIELMPICSPKFRPGKPPEQAQVLGEFLNDVIKSALDDPFRGIAVGKPGCGLVWYLYVDIYCLNHDGNLLDASLLALIAALKNVRLPAVGMSDDGTAFVDPAAPSTRLSIGDYPVALTFGMIDDYILADPTSEEEELLQGSFTIVYKTNATLCSVVKPGGAAVGKETLQECMEQCKRRVSEAAALLDAASNSTAATAATTASASSSLAPSALPTTRQ